MSLQPVTIRHPVEPWGVRYGNKGGSFEHEGFQLLYYPEAESEGEPWGDQRPLAESNEQVIDTFAGYIELRYVQDRRAAFHANATPQEIGAIGGRLPARDVAARLVNDARPPPPSPRAPA